jgi:hypothetical protein
MSVSAIEIGPANARLQIIFSQIGDVASGNMTSNCPVRLYGDSGDLGYFSVLLKAHVT